MFKMQRDSEEYQAACKLWEVYLLTKNEFVQPGEGDADDEDGEESMDNTGMSAEEEARDLISHHICDTHVHVVIRTPPTQV